MVPPQVSIEELDKKILCPLTYLQVMEYWSLSIHIALASRRISSIRRGPHSYVTHLLFVDDMSVFIKDNKSSSKGIKDMLCDFVTQNGLGIN